MAIDQKLIDRINELAKLKKEGAITDEQLKEQEALRKEYIEKFRGGLRQQLESTIVLKEVNISRLNINQDALERLTNDERIHQIKKEATEYVIAYDIKKIDEHGIHKLIAPESK